MLLLVLYCCADRSDLLRSFVSAISLCVIALDRTQTSGTIIDAAGGKYSRVQSRSTSVCCMLIHLHCVFPRSLSGMVVSGISIVSALCLMVQGMKRLKCCKEGPRGMVRSSSGGGGDGGGGGGLGNFAELDDDSFADVA